MKSIPNTCMFLCSIIIWLFLFQGGAILDSGYYYGRFQDSEECSICKLINFSKMLATWTWTNLLLLVIFSSLLGEFGRIAMTTSTKVRFVGPMIRGFFIYLMLVAGQLIINGEITVPGAYAALEDGTEPLQQAYLRFAFLCSLFGFTVGYRPEFFHEFLKKFVGQNSNGERVLAVPEK